MLPSEKKDRMNVHIGQLQVKSLLCGSKLDVHAESYLIRYCTVVVGIYLRIFRKSLLSLFPVSIILDAPELKTQTARSLEKQITIYNPKRHHIL